jgi:DivIVA domain-containing protein
MNAKNSAEEAQKPAERTKRAKRAKRAKHSKRPDVANTATTNVANTTNAAKTAKISKKEPRIRRRLRGYRRGQVDAVLARIAGTLGTADLSGPPITAEETRASRFRLELRGYDRRLVDELLSERIRELEAYEQVGGYNARHARTRAPARFSPVSADWLVGWITTAQFGVVRVRRGYDERDVDAFLARVVAGLQGDAPPVSGRDVAESRFRTIRFGASYEEREVDRFLDQLASALDGLSKG